MIRRIVLSALIALTLSVLPLAAQTPVLSVDLGTLGLGYISAIRPVELDGRPGSEFVVKVGNPFISEWQAIYPQAPMGMCVSPTFTLAPNDTFVDLNADGRQEIIRFDPTTQTVTFLAIPGCTPTTPR